MTTAPNTSGGDSSTPPEGTPAELDTPQDGRVDETADDAPVYDERGNVRPRGTPGAKPMTFDQRAALARKQGRGGQVPPDGEPAVRKAAEAATKKTTAPRRRRR